MLEHVRLTEQRRTAILSELALLMRRPASEISAASLAMAIQGWDLKLADQLRSVRQALVILMERVRESNRHNSELLDRSLRMVEDMKKNLLGEVQRSAETYNPQGQKGTGAAGAAPPSRLISKEA